MQWSGRRSLVEFWIRAAAASLLGFRICQRIVNSRGEATTTWVQEEAYNGARSDNTTWVHEPLSSFREETMPSLTDWSTEFFTKLPSRR
jgi:hypothetical protein